MVNGIVIECSCGKWWGSGGGVMRRVVGGGGGEGWSGGEWWGSGGEVMRGVVGGGADDEGRGVLVRQQFYDARYFAMKILYLKTQELLLSIECTTFY